jgi:hypothetical protein
MADPIRTGVPDARPRALVAIRFRRYPILLGAVEAAIRACGNWADGTRPT